MKKYVKPDLFYENFELSHTVANCNPAMGHSEDGCDYDSNELFGILEPGETVFSSESCTYTLHELNLMWSDYCLQTGSESYVLFTS